MMNLNEKMGVGAKAIRWAVIPQQADRIRRRVERDRGGGGFGTNATGVDGNGT